MGNWIRAALCCVGFLGSAQASALEVEIQGDIAVVSGGVDYPDIRRVKDAHAKGVRTIVMREVGGGDIDAFFGLAMVVADLKLTMVVDGLCAGACPFLLLRAPERRFIAPTGEQPVGVLIRSAVFRGDSTGPANIPEVYVHMRAGLTDKVSNALLDRHTTGSFENGALIFFPVGQYAGTVDCEDLANAARTCKQVPGVDAFNSGVFTSAEPYVMPRR